MSEYISTILLCKHYQRGGGKDPVPVVRRQTMPALLPIEQLKKQDPDVIDGYFTSVESAREARLAILLERHGPLTAASIAAQLENDEDQ